MKMNEHKRERKRDVITKAMRQTEIFELFVFASFRNVRFSKFGIFSEKNPNFLNSQKFRKNSSEIISEIISCFWVKKPSFWVKKLGKSLEKVQKKFRNRGFRTFGIYGKFGICSIPNFPKITKNDIKIEFWKSNFGNRKKLVLT